MRERERVRRYLALLLAFTMIFTSSSMNVLAATVVGGYKNSDKSQITTEESETSVETEIPEAAENDTEIRKNIVTFSTNGHAHVVVDGAAVDSTAYAKDGKIVFDVAVENGYQIESVLVDKSINARTTENGSYIIEGIQTDNTTVDITTVEVETEAQTEAVTETESESESESETESETEAQVTQYTSIAVQSIKPAETNVITYKFMNGETEVDTQYITDGDSLTEPESPSKDGGYKFVGWYVGNTKVRFGSPITVSETTTVTATARFEEVHYVFFHNTEGAIVATKEGKSGASITTSDVKFAVGGTESITGWYDNPELSGKAVTSVTLTGQNVDLYAKVESGFWITYDSAGGTYVEPEFYVAGSTAKLTAQPTRAGYDFAGWFDGDTEVTTTTSEKNVTAKWNVKASVDYKVIIWQQKVTDDQNASDSQKSYEYVTTLEKTGKPGTTVSADSIKNTYVGFDKNTKKSTDIEIKADGSTILNVYYDRVLCTVNYYVYNAKKYKWEIKKTITGLYGANLKTGEWWTEYYWYSNRGSNSGTGTGCILLTTYDFATAGYKKNQGNDIRSDGTVRTCNFYGASKDTSKNVHYYNEQADGSFVLVDTINSGSGTLTIHEKYAGYDLYKYTTSIKNGDPTKADFWKSKTDCKDGDTSTNKDTYIANKLKEYKLDYSNEGSIAKTETIKYTASLKGKDTYIPTRPKTVDPNYYFSGWYSDPECTTLFDFNSTMPAANLVVYAGWKAPDVTVKAHVGENSYDVDEIEYGDTVDQGKLPNVESTLGENETFLGWFTKNEDGTYTAWNFNAQVRRNVDLYARIIQKGTFTVSYNANGGTGDFSDESNYVQGAKADIQSSAGIKGPQGKKFLYWATQADGSGDRYYPNDRIEIENANITLYAIWSESATASLIYMKNDGTTESYTEDGLKNNQTVEAAGAIFTRPGYEFLGWSKNGSAKTPEYNAGTRMIVHKDDSENTLYAVWKEKEYSYTVHYYWNLTTTKVAEDKTVDKKKYEESITEVPVTADGYTAVKSSETITIGESNNEITFYYYKNVALQANGDIVTYDGKKHTVSGYTGAPEEAEFNITVGAEGIDVGTYPANFAENTVGTVDATKKYIVTEANNNNLIINKDGTLLVAGIDYNGIYDGNEHGDEAVASVTEGTTISYKVGEEDWTTTAPTIKDVGSKSVTVKAENPNYETAEATYTLTVNPKDVTVTADSKSKVYGDADPELTADVSGLLGTDRVTYTLSRAAGEEEGTYAITPAGEEIQGNYKVTYHPGTLTITAQSIVPEDPSYRGIQIDDPRDYEYDAQEHKWEPTVTDKEGNELIEGTDYTVSYDTENFVDVKTITATITGMGNYSGTVIKTYQITPAPATVTAANKSKMFGEADPELTADVSGLYGTDTVEYTLSREPGEDVGEYVITASGEADQGNYTVTYYPGTLTITKKGTLTVTGTPYEGIYDGNEHGSAASANVTEGTTISYKVGEEDWTTTAPTIKDVGSKSVTVKAENPNYETAEAVYTLTVNPKDVTVTADSKSKVYGDADSELTADVSGLLGADQITYTLSRAAGEEEGTYAITPAGDADQGNYTVTYYPGTLTITAQSIVPEDPSYRGIQIDDPRDYEYDAQEHKWEPTVTDKEGNKLTKGTDYTVSYDTENFVDVKTITVTITGKGSYTGTVTRVYSITPAPVKITTDSDSKVYDGTPLTAGGTVTGLVNGETVSFVTTGSQTEVGFSDNTYTLAWDQTAKKGNYNVVKEEIGTLTVTENTNEIVVTTTGGTFVYDGQPHGAKVSVSALPEGYTLKAAASSASATDVTETDVKATADTLVIVNKDGVDVTNKLNIKRHDGTIKVTPAAVTIITQGATKVYDGTPLTAGGTMTGLVNGETAGFETTGSQTDVGSRYNNYSTIWSVPGMPYPYTAKRSNYTVEDTRGILRVTAQSIVPDPENPESYLGIKISNPQNHVYDGQEHKWTPTVTDKDGKILKEGTDYTVSYNEPAEETEAFKDVQTITVTIEGTGNYTGTATRVYHITPAPVTITTDSDSKVYDGTPLTAGGTVTGLAEGETVGFKTTGSQTEVGFSDNTYEIAWAGEEVQDSDKELVPYTAKRSNYMIENILGRLTVTAQSIEPEDPSYRGIQIDDPSDHEYDAQEHKWEPMVTDKDGNKLTKGTDYTVSYDTDNFVDVKTITVTITGMGNYSGTVIKTYQITPKEVTIRTYTDSKVYDGNALTADGEINGLVEGETVGFETTGSQTYVGSSDNTYEITWAQEEVEVQASDKESTPYTAKKSNYTVSETIGTLTVTDGTEKEPVEPSLVVKKNDEQADGYQYKLGETVSFTISVTNIYDEAKDVTITELAGVIIEGADAGTPNVLVKSNVAPGETVTATATYTITEEDVANGFFRNTVKAAFNGGKTFENEKTVDTEEADRSYSLNKISSESAHESGMFKAGETIHYTITAVNTGNQTIKNLQIEDTLKAAGTISNITAEGVTYTQNGNTTVFTIAELPAKAYNAEKAAPVVIEYDYLVQEADKGNVISNAIIGRDPEDPEKPGEGGGTENTVEDPKLEVTKDVVSIAAEDGTAKEVTGKASLNDVITYQVTVKNTGNIRLMNVKLADSLEDIVLAENDSFDLGTLDVGEEKKVTYTYTVKEADLGSTIVNVATATGDVPEDPEDTPKPSGEDKKEVPTDEKSAAIQVTKTVTSKGSTITVDGKETTGYRVGDTIEFNIHVENTGNITVNNIVVNDVPTLSAGSPKGSITIAAAENGEYTVDGSTAAIAALAPKASVDIKASYLVIAGDGTENGNELFNTAFVTGTSEDPDNPQPEDSSKTDPVPIEPESDGHGEMQGTITVTKMITTSANKTPENGVDAVIKVGLYDNASFSGTPVAVNTITISKGTSGTTVFDELDNTSGTIYYVAELDDNNNPIIGTSSHLKGYGAPHYSENCKNGINPTEEDNADATIVNPLAEDDQEETEITTETTGKSTTSTKSSTAAKTGDNTNMMVYWILLGMAALAGCTAVVYRKKKRNQ